MKKNKIIYWSSTGIITVMMLLSAYAYIVKPEMKGAFAHFGFPDYFRIELALAKIIGAIVLIIPMIPKNLKQFAYFGFALTFISAAIAHLSVGDAFNHALMPLVFTGILAVSYLYNNKISKLKSV